MPLVEPPQDFICPLSLELMRDPVVTEVRTWPRDLRTRGLLPLFHLWLPTSQDGQSYDREGIERWLDQHDTSPITGERLESRRLIPNIRLRSAVQEWLQINWPSENSGRSA